MLKHYLTTALRHFRQHKLTTSINVACLTIGLVCFLAIYSTVTYMRNGDRHYANADRVYMITWRVNSSPTVAMGSWLTSRYLRPDFPELTTVARSTFSTGSSSEAPVAVGDKKAFVHVVYADAEFLDVFALPFLAGDPKNALRSPKSGVISKDTAVRLFGSIPNALGHSLRLQDGTEIAIQGVVDEPKQPSIIKTSGDNSLGMVRFDVLLSADVFESDALISPIKQQYLKNWVIPICFTYVVLPQDGSLTVESLRNRLKSFGARHADASGRTFEFGAVPVSDYWLTGLGALTGADKTGIPATLMFYFLGAVVLLTSCLNYANLATAQATVRAKEIGMRRVVGARRGQIIMQFMIEAALLSFAALLSALSLIAAAVAATKFPGSIAIAEAAATSFTFWLMLLSLVSVVTIAAGMYPAFVLSSVRPIQAVRAGKAHSGGRFVPRVLVSLQFGFASFLLISMLVMVEQNVQLKRAAFSGSANAMVEVSNNIRAARIDYDALRLELLRQPHVQAVSASAASPWTALAGPYTVKASLDQATRSVSTTQNNINHDFFSTMGIELLAGRVFDRDHADDNRLATNAQSLSTTKSVVIDQALAEQNGWPHPNDAVGKTIYGIDIETPNGPALPRTIIGVVGNRAMSIITGNGSTSNLYVLDSTTAVYPIIRISTADGAVAFKEIESVWNKFAPSVALKMRFADEALNRNYQIFEMIATVFSGIATLALVIAILGLIGMSIHVIGRRQHEIGVRKTLGASVQSIVRLLLSDFSKPVIIANVLAWPVAFIAMRVYLSMFTHQTGLSAIPFVAGLVITVFIAWIAVGAQATRAARMNPAMVLRHE